MRIPFKKFSGNGNDFVLLDHPKEKLTPDIIKKLCDRRFGIGADGVLVLTSKEGFDGEMRIFNSDGSEAEMCANGLRSLVTYLDSRKTEKKNSYLIKTPNAKYEVLNKEGKFAIEMAEIKEIGLYDLSRLNLSTQTYFVNTGVPHLVLLKKDVDALDIKKEGAYFRYHDLFPKGTNVNFVEILNEKNKLVKVRTYERGVEDETYSCGTGLVATALALKKWFSWSGKITLKTLGGEQVVSLGENVLYSGEVQFCFEGDFLL